MSRISVSTNGSIVAPNNMGGLDVVFGGVEVYEIRTRELLGLRRAFALAGLVALMLVSAFAWLRGHQTAQDQIRQGIVATGSFMLYGIWFIRQVGVVWRFDHKRKTITRRHWLRGMSRSWKSTQVAGARIINGKTRIGAPVLQLGLVNNKGEMIAEVARWDADQVDRNQVETVMSQIKRVMWWK